MTDADVRAAGRDEWELGKLVIDTKQGQFLTVSGNRAVELGLAQAKAANREAVAARYDVENRLTIVEETAVDRSVEILNNPWVTGILFVLGIISLYIEFSVPGIGVAGMFSLLCFGLFFWSRFLGGTAEMLEIMLFLAGIAFLCVELFVLPGFGIAGLTGILLMLSVVLASLKFIIPQSEHQTAQFIQSMMVMTGSGVASIGAIMFLSRYFKSLPLFSQLALPPPDPNAGTGEVAASPAAAETSSLVGGIPLAIGTRGTAETPLRPAGKMRVGDRLIDVVTDNEFIDPGVAVEVSEIHASRVVVREVPPA
jgi:membrane-bound serine protease (ClpP class)